MVEKFDGPSRRCGSSPDDPRTATDRSGNGFDRRQFLRASSAVAAAGALAGCGSSDSETPTGTNTTAETNTSAPNDSDGGGSTDATAVNAKTRPSFWTVQDREHARRNVEEYDWARSKRDVAADRADGYLASNTLDDLWHLVTAQNVPRSSFISPNHHWDTEFHGSWNGITEPWKLSDGQYTFPTNDFEAYRESGRDDRGMFDPELADDQYLVNEEHPGMGEDWGVDDGYGWRDDDDDLGQGAGAWWTFVAHYNHWAVWRPGGIVSMVEVFTDAYLFTGDRTYSRACAVLLDRIADVYPEMDVSEYRSPRGGGHYRNSTGGRQTGKVIGSHWEPNLIRPILRAYDAIFPGMAGDRELVSFLDAKTEEYPGLSGKGTIGEIRKNIEDGVFREILPAAKASQLAPNRGQLPAVTTAARVLDEPEGYTREALEWVFQPGEETFTGSVWYAEPENWKTTGGDVMTKLVDVTDRDGYMDQSAPLYNPIAHASTLDIGDLLRGYDGFDGADLYEHPKFHRLMHSHIPLIMLDEFTPLIGDTHPDRLYLDEDAKRNAFEAYGEDVFGQTVHFTNGFSSEGLRGDVFDADPTSLRTDVEAVIEANGPLDLDSTMDSAYGFTALRDGSNYDAGEVAAPTYDFLALDIADRSAEVERYPKTLQLEAEEAERSISFEFDVAEGGTYYLALRPFKAIDFGEYEIAIDGTVVGTYDFYDRLGGARDDFDVFAESVDLSAGSHTIAFTNVGKHDDATGYKMGVIQLRTYDPAAWERYRKAGEYGNVKRGVWTYYGRTGDYGVHTHRDTLNLGVMAHELDLAPDNGYPSKTGDWPRRRHWHVNTIAHNTVMVDERRQEDQRVAEPKHFDHTETVQLSDVEAPDVYPRTDEYRRTTAMVHVDEENSYAVDFFRVDGGDDHRFSFHGAVGDVSTDGLDLVPQDGGTYAGPDVPRPKNVAEPDSAYNEEVGNGFNYLDNVSRDEDPSDVAAIDWDVEDYWDDRDDGADVHLRLTLLGDHDEIAVMDGHGPDVDDQPDVIKYAIARRTGENLTSTFTSVLEPYVEERFVESVEAVPVSDDGGDPVDARAVRVELSNGRTDYVARGVDRDTTYRVDGAFSFEGFFAVYSERNGAPVHAYLADGRRLSANEEPLLEQSFGRFSGAVVDFTGEMSLENEIEVELDGHADDIDDAIGGHAYVQTDGLVNGVYPIEDASANGGDRATFHVGERTTIERFRDPDELEGGGYEYYLSEGDRFYVPRTIDWSAD